MKKQDNSLILRIRHGYGNIKTANDTFGTDVYVSITERLKEENQLEWAQRMNNILHRATEIENEEPIYV